MPSKKKARSQARKAKKEQARQQAVASGNGSANPGGPSCSHIKLPEDRTLEDFKEALALFMDFNTTYEACHTRMGEAEKLLARFRMRGLLM
jgi:hypothetical protein